MKVQINPPQNWQDFEDLCHKLWSSIWGDINTQKNGRPGQKQHGIDIFGNPIYSNGVHGVQCKGKTTNYGSELTVEELEKESKEAENLGITIQEFTIATTSPRNTNVQKRALEINEKKERKFPVSVWSWDDITDELHARPEVYSTIYNTQLNIPTHSTLHLSRNDRGDKIFAFLTRPIFHDAISPSLLKSIGEFLFEISDNAFRHGNATYVNFSFLDNHILEIKDNGKKFNPFSDFSTKTNGGYNTTKSLSEKCEEKLEKSYSYENNENILILNFEKDFLKTNIHTIEIEYPKSSKYYDSKEEAQNHAKNDVTYILENKIKIKLLIKSQGTPSSIIAYLQHMCNTIPKHIESISLPNNQLETFVKNFNIEYKIR